MTNVGDILTATGLTYRQLDHWTNRGFIRADQRNPGSGRRRTWNDSELAVAALMKRLAGAGLDVQVAAKVSRQLVAKQQHSVELADGIELVIHA